MPRRQSRAEAAIEARLQEVDPKSYRYEVLVAARAFRASWVALGEHLTKVREEHLYRAWGYGSFEAYARRELHLRRDTANKLTRSFGFVRDHRPEVLEEAATREIPPLDVVDLLAQARERAKVSREQFDGIQREVFESDAPPSRQAVVRRFREVDPEAFKRGSRRTVTGVGDVPVDVRKAMLLAERLKELLEAMPEVPLDVLRGASRVADHLRERFEAGRRQSA